MSKKPKGPPERALTTESELDDDALDRIIGGVGLRTEGYDENDGWSQIVDDHSKEIPANPSRPDAPQRPRKPGDSNKR